jgi:hypothetical protein
MAKSDDGGPAFPGAFSGHCGNENHAEPCGCYVDSGMSLRDYFAAQALNGIQIINIETAKAGKVSDFSDECSMAKTAYLIADAMIAARKKQ